MIINKGRIITVSAGKNKVINKVKKRVFLPLKLKEEKANAPRVPVIIFPSVVQVATMKEFKSILLRFIISNASL